MAGGEDLAFPFLGDGEGENGWDGFRGGAERKGVRNKDEDGWFGGGLARIEEEADLGRGMYW